jgi:hypothetical protein
MQNTNNFDRDVQALLDMIGGDSLAGSGFEGEQSHPDYGSEEEE